MDQITYVAGRSSMNQLNEKIIEEGWSIKMVIPEIVATGAGTYGGKEGGVYVVLTKNKLEL